MSKIRATICDKCDKIIDKGEVISERDHWNWPANYNTKLGTLLDLHSACAYEVVEDMVDIWHERSTGVELQIFLRLTEDEYKRWVEKNKLCDFCLINIFKNWRNIKSANI